MLLRRRKRTMNTSPFLLYPASGNICSYLDGVIRRLTQYGTPASVSPIIVFSLDLSPKLLYDLGDNCDRRNDNEVIRL